MLLPSAFLHVKLLLFCCLLSLQASGICLDSVVLLSLKAPIHAIALMVLVPLMIPTQCFLSNFPAILFGP